MFTQDYRDRLCVTPDNDGESNGARGAEVLALSN